MLNDACRRALPAGSHRPTEARAAFRYGPKVIAFKKRRRQNSRRKRGHRQDFTVVRIGSFTLNGQSLAAAPVAQAAESEPALVESVTVE